MRCAACDEGIAEKAAVDKMKCGEYWDLCARCREGVKEINPIYNFKLMVTGEDEHHLFGDRRQIAGRERVYITRDMEDAWDVLDITSRAPSADVEALTACPYTQMAACIASAAAERAGATDALNRFLKETGEAP